MKKKLDEVVLVTGGFDPIHKGHISYLKAAKKLSDFLVVGINSDKWLMRKKNYFFMPYDERESVIKSLKVVDMTINFNDDDGSALNAIEKCKIFSKQVIFANGGDRKDDNIPEISKFDNDKDVKFVFSIGGEKKLNSSSVIVEDFLSKSLEKKNQRTPWGSFVTFNKGDGYKIKMLTVKKNQKLSLQYHNRRTEQWIIVKGKALVQLNDKIYELKAKDHLVIPKKQKHRVENIGGGDLVILEANFGSYIEEDDIVRLDDIYNRVI